MERDDGSTTIAVLVLLVLVAAAAGGGMLIMTGALAVERRSRDAYDLRRTLEGEARRVADALAQDPTPASDSTLDPVWETLDAPGVPDVTVTLADVSSALDPNWIQKFTFTRTGLKTLLKDPASADVLQQRRVDKGFFTNLEAAYGDLFVDGALEKYFTPYGYPNINTTDEFALQKLYALRTGNEAGAEVFHTRIQGLLASQRLLKPDQLRAFLGLDYDTLYPVMNVEPSMNVNFLEPRILSDLLAYPELKVPHPASTAEALVDLRGSREITTADLRRMIGAPEDNRIYQYLGATTWFWKIDVQHPSATLSLVVARLPAESGLGQGAGSGAASGERPRFTTVEERYQRP